MKLEDYLFLDCDEPYRIDFIEYCEYLLSSGFEEIESKICSLLDLKKLPTLSSDEIVEGVIFKSIKDLKNKQQNKNYYQSNAVCMLNSLKGVITEDVLERLKASSNNELLIYNYTSLVKDILLDYMDLENLYRGDKLQRSQHTMSMYQTYRQLVFGQCSFHSFVEKEVNMSITLIRQAIEVRVRRAIGVLGIENSNGIVEPLPMSTIFKVLGDYKSEVKFAVPLDKLIRIYNWANIFVHTGVVTYRWLPVMLEKYLKPILIGQKKDEKNWHIDNGIEMSSETYEKIKEVLSEALKENSKFYECRPEAIIHE